MKKVITIREYESFCSVKNVNGYKYLDEATFNQLERFILENNNKDTDALDLMAISVKKNVGKVITAKNFVGIIMMKNGTTIEILPKIYSNTGYTDNQVKELLIKMLKTLKNSPFKSLQSANLNITTMNVFEIFIRLFLDEVFFIVKHGLKCNYEKVQDNLGVVKGKIIFNKHIQLNHSHKERCYSEFDVFNTNRPENKLLKTTLEYLYMQSSSVKNKTDIKTLLSSFSDVDCSTDYKKDFDKCVIDRNMKDYEMALVWAKIFLQGKSFTSFSGSEVAQALLFPMETLFESYIATKFKKGLDLNQYSISVQDKSYCLFEHNFRLRPDIVIRNKAKKSTFVMDTKWKVLSDRKHNYGIAQADMYQMYAYQKKYNAETITLLYPLTEEVSNTDISFKSNDGVIVNVRFLDLFDINNSIIKLVEEISNNE